LPSKNNETSEPNVPRISFALTVLGCFQAIYPNVSHYFEEEKYPYLDFYVYRPKFTGRERIRWPEDLTNDRWVWDAHITSELVALDPVQMVLDGKVRIFNCADRDGIETHLFDDISLPTRMVYPVDIDFKSLSPPRTKRAWTQW
jgi:hypothetical protein